MQQLAAIERTTLIFFLKNKESWLHHSKDFNISNNINNNNFSKLKVVHRHRHSKWRHPADETTPRVWLKLTRIPKPLSLSLSLSLIPQRLWQVGVREPGRVSFSYSSSGHPPPTSSHQFLFLFISFETEAGQKKVNSISRFVLDIWMKIASKKFLIELSQKNGETGNLKKEENILIRKNNIGSRKNSKTHVGDPNVSIKRHLNSDIPF